MSNKAPEYNLPADFFDKPFDSEKTNSTAPGIDLMSKGYVFRQSIVGSPEHNYMFNAFSTLMHNGQAMGLFLPFNPDENSQSIVATPKGGCVSMIEDGTNETTFWVALNERPIGYLQPDLDAGNWVQIKLADLATLDNFVKKSGDVMTGSLTVGNNGSGSPNLILQNGTFMPSIRAITETKNLEFVNSANSKILFSLNEDGQPTFPYARPSWAGLVPWDSGNLNPVRAFPGSIDVITIGWDRAAKHLNFYVGGGLIGYINTLV